MEAVPLGMLFAVCAAAIARAGYLLSVTADALAQRHGWGRGWVGLALLATVTSLPELASGISAVTTVAAPDLAIGNALGACLINLAFLGVVDALQRRQPLYAAASASHRIPAGFGLAMFGIVAIGLAFGDRTPAVLGVGLYSPVLLALYLVALRSVHASERSAVQARNGDPDDTRPRVGPGSPGRRFAAAAAVVVVAGVALPHVADGLARELELSGSLAGTLLMAAVTTLPEAAVTLGALRIGAVDLAIANLLGSNLFNVVIIAIDDAFYRRGPLLADAAPVHAGSAIGAALMSGLVLAGLVTRPRGRVLRGASWVGLGLLALYLFSAMRIVLSGG